jgi:hypothetical protein
MWLYTIEDYKFVADCTQSIHSLLRILNSSGKFDHYWLIMDSNSRGNVVLVDDRSGKVFAEAPDTDDAEPFLFEIKLERINAVGSI